MLWCHFKGILARGSSDIEKPAGSLVSFIRTSSVYRLLFLLSTQLFCALFAVYIAQWNMVCSPLKEGGLGSYHFYQSIWFLWVISLEMCNSYIRKLSLKMCVRQNFGKEHEGWFPKDLDSKMVLVHGKVIGEVSRISSAIVNYFIADKRHVRSCLMYESRFSFDEAFSKARFEYRTSFSTGFPVVWYISVPVRYWVLFRV